MADNHAEESRLGADVGDFVDQAKETGTSTEKLAVDAGMAAESPKDDEKEELSVPAADSTSIPAGENAEARGAHPNPVIGATDAGAAAAVKPQQGQTDAEIEGFAETASQSSSDGTKEEESQTNAEVKGNVEMGGEGRPSSDGTEEKSEELQQPETNAETKDDTKMAHEGEGPPIQEEEEEEEKDED